MRIGKVHISITFRKLNRPSQIADTQNVTDDSSRGTVTWAMPPIAKYASSCFLCWHLWIQVPILGTHDYYVEVHTTEGIHSSSSIRTHHYRKEPARLVIKILFSGAHGHLGFEDWLTFCLSSSYMFCRDCGQVTRCNMISIFSLVITRPILPDMDGVENVHEL